jgi:tRNA(fMet)-specific endonuclease VapC
MSATGNSALLDTNIVIAYFKKDASVRQSLLQHSLTYLPLTVLGELYYGAYKSSRTQQSLVEVHDFLNVATVLVPGPVTSDYYGKIKADLARAGTPIPQNDIWIAALALEHQLPLAARDKHFKLIRGLTVLDW